MTALFFLFVRGNSREALGALATSSEMIGWRRSGKLNVPQALVDKLKEGFPHESIRIITSRPSLPGRSELAPQRNGADHAGNETNAINRTNVINTTHFINRTDLIC